MIYLDQAATTMPKPPEVYRAVQHAMMSCASVGRSGHAAAMNAGETVYNCRVLAGELFDAEPEQVAFTFNATHGLNMAIRTLIHPGDRVVISGFEHNAVLRPLHQLGAEICVAGRRLFDAKDTLEAFARCITWDTKAVICTHVSNVFGYILPITQIAELCRKRNVPLIVDASQSAGVLPISLRKTGASFICAPGHKALFGPQGTGLLLCGQLPEPLLCGGTGSRSQSRDMPAFLPDRAEAGTHNVPGIAGLMAGLQYIQATGLDKIRAHEQLLLKMLFHSLKGHREAELFYAGGDLQTGVMSLRIQGEDCETTAERLAESGIAVRAGLHCAPLAHESANTLETGTVRVSFSALNTPEDVTRLAEILLSGQN